MNGDTPSLPLGILFPQLIVETVSHGALTLPVLARDVGRACVKTESEGEVGKEVPLLLVRDSG